MLVNQANSYTGSFGPLGNTTCIAVTNVSSNTTFTQYNQILITNSGTNAAFIAFGTSTVTVVIPVAGTPANGMIILPGTTQTFTPPFGSNNIGAITASSTTTLYITQGEGQ